jgi:chromate transporter
VEKFENFGGERNHGAGEPCHGGAGRPSFGEAARFWAKLGWISFGGPTGQIAIMHTELVEKKRWIGEERFLHALNFCMLLPGPEATQLAIYCGWLLHRTWGGIVAGVLFVLPAAGLLWGLSWIYVTYGALAEIAAVFHGLKAAVLAIVVAAVLRIGKKALNAPWKWAVATGAFGGIFFWAVPFPAIVAGAAVVGWLAGRARSEMGDLKFEREDQAETGRRTEPPTWGRAGRIVGVGGVLWAAPVIAAGWWQGWDGVLVREGIFFSKAAMVTFGGAYAVLPYVGQQAVEHHGWLTAPQMLDGLGLAETTPGPLIMVLQFVGFLGGWNQPGGMAPLVAATLGAAMTTWVTFVPCFLWIFLGAPHVERWRANVRLAGALAAVTAAVVGVVLNLAVWFGWHVVRPGAVGAAGAGAGGVGGGAVGVIDGTDWFAVVVGLGAFAAMQWGKAGVVAVVLVSGLAGLAWGWAG